MNKEAALAKWAMKYGVSAKDLQDALEGASGVPDLMQYVPLPSKYAASRMLSKWRKVNGMGEQVIPPTLAKVAPALRRYDSLVQKKRVLEVELESVMREIEKYQAVAKLAENMKRELDRLEVADSK